MSKFFGSTDVSESANECVVCEPASERESTQPSLLKQQRRNSFTLLRIYVHLVNKCTLVVLTVYEIVLPSYCWNFYPFRVSLRSLEHFNSTN